MSIPIHFKKWTITTLLGIVLTAAMPVTLSAQQRTVKGVIKADDGVGLPGVSILEKGTTNGVVTDMDGNFSLSVESDASVLVVSFIGMKTAEVSVGNRTQIDVILEPDLKTLNEVVVIGYGEVDRKELTGSVSSLASKQIRDIPVNTAAEALAGRLAGVQVTTTEGRPGADILVRVRGGTSITQDNAPLYIVDGIQVENALSFLSPQEIQSIDVLKDAASSAIYGARGANGVIIITTKGGKEMPTQVTYNGFAGVRSIVKKLDVMNPYDYVQYQYQIYNNNTNEQTRNDFQKEYGRWEDLDIYKSVPSTDWQDEVFGRDAFSQTHVLALTGGTKTTSFNITLNHAAEEGIMLESGYKRTMASFKFDHRISDRAKTGLSLRYSRQRIDGVGTSATGTQSTNRLRNAVRFRPYVAPEQETQVDEFDPDYANQTNLTNPVLLARNELKYDYKNDVLVNGWFSYDITKKLTFRTVVGVTGTDRKTNTFNGSVTSVARQNNDQPVIVMGGNEIFTINNSNTLNYKTKLEGDHSIDLLIGHEMIERSFINRSTTIKWLPKDITAKQAFASIQKATPPAGLVQDAPTTNEYKDKLLSFFGRASYNYAGKYFATVNVRRDASSLFASENHDAIFPSGSIAWRIGDENFMTNTKNWLSDLKLRVSMGTVGNNRIGVDLFKTMYSASANDGYAVGEAVTPGLVATELANPDLRWESTTSRNIGVDFALFNKLNVTVDLYRNTTKDLLLYATIPQTSGYASQLQNIGKTENKGLEIQVEGIVLNRGDFSWTANYNMAFNRNKIVSLGIAPNGDPLNSYLVASGWVNSTYQDFKVEVGKPVGQFYGYVTDGFYTLDDFDYNATNGTYTLKDGIPNSRNVALGNRDPQPGDLKLKKLSESSDMVIGANDRTVLGNTQPKFTGGFNQQFVYKGFDLSIFMNFSVGNKVYNANKLEFTTQYLYRDNNMLALMNDRWKMVDEGGAIVTDPDQLRTMNANTKYWTPSGGAYFLHSFAIEDGSFLRISNLTLGYTIPSAILKKIKAFSSFRVYATVNNLWTITGYSGYDPEANTRRSSPLTPGVDYAAYPRSRFILAGVNLTF